MPDAVFTLWWTGLIVTWVVFVPVAIYSLHRTWRAAQSIRSYAADALVAAGGIAAGTAHVTALNATMEVAGQMVASAGEIRKKLDTVANVLIERAG
jgi:hypothetical protein